MAAGRYQDASLPSSPVNGYSDHLHQQQQQTGAVLPGGHDYPPPLNSRPPSFQSHDGAAGSHDLQSPPQSAYPTSPTVLPKYSTNYNSMYQPVSSNGLSPLNPNGQQQVGTNGNGNGRYKPDPRYSSYSTNTLANSNGGPHPLSHAYYAESSPTLHGSTDDLAKKEKDGLASPASLPYDRSDSGFKRFSGNFINGKRISTDDPSAAVTMVRKKRLGYLDGLKFIAAWIVLNGTLFDAAVPDDVSSSPLVIQLRIEPGE